jgi:hypothetical protein
MWKDSLGAQPPPNMSTYSQAMEKFTRSAAAFMEHLHHLSQARAAYAEAMQASITMRASLDASDQALRSLMKQLEEAVNTHVGQAVPEKKGPELVRIEPNPRAELGKH